MKGCSLQHKDTKNESKSQPCICFAFSHLVVLYNTKILKMKANHNKEKDFQENVFHMPEWRVHLPSSPADGCRMIYKYNT